MAADDLLCGEPGNRRSFDGDFHQLRDGSRIGAMKCLLTVNSLAAYWRSDGAINATEHFAVRIRLWTDQRST